MGSGFKVLESGWVRVAKFCCLGGSGFQSLATQVCPVRKEMASQTCSYPGTRATLEPGPGPCGQWGNHTKLVLPRRQGVPSNVQPNLPGNVPYGVSCAASATTRRVGLFREAFVRLHLQADHGIDGKISHPRSSLKSRGPLPKVIRPLSEALCAVNTNFATHFTPGEPPRVKWVAMSEMHPFPDVTVFSIVGPTIGRFQSRGIWVGVTRRNLPGSPGGASRKFLR